VPVSGNNVSVKAMTRAMLVSFPAIDDSCYQPGDWTAPTDFEFGGIVSDIGA
jgi:hypothetical protein